MYQLPIIPNMNKIYHDNETVKLSQGMYHVIWNQEKSIVRGVKNVTRKAWQHSTQLTYFFFKE